MPSRAVIRPLLPALGAALAGGIGLALSAPPVLHVAIAALGAAGGAMLARREPRHAGAMAAARRKGESEAAELSVLRTAFDALPFGVLVVKSDRTIELANAGIAEQFGVALARGVPVGTLRARRLLDRIDGALDEGGASTLDFSVQRQGEALLKAHIRPLPGGSVLVAIVDETQARRTRELHRDFVANASHELKTPLAAISGIVETLGGHAREDAEATERFLGLLAAQATRMTRLVDDLLSLNRIELNERVAPGASVPLQPVIEAAIDRYRPAAEAAGVRLELRADTCGTTLRGDRDELVQLFGNLVENAVKYSGTGATVRVETRPGEETEAGMIGIAVADDGPGIARDHVPRLTERFYRVDAHRSRERGGTGLGLAIVKHIVNHHRGRLEIESAPGRGSTFTVWLPVDEPGALARAGGGDSPAGHAP